MTPKLAGRMGGWSPRNAAFEGSYGTNSYGDERPRGPGACADRIVGECIP